jgi:hypothetical protein
LLTKQTTLLQSLHLVHKVVLVQQVPQEQQEVQVPQEQLEALDQQEVQVPQEQLDQQGLKVLQVM